MKSHAVAEPSTVATAKRPATAVRSSRAGQVQTKLAVGSPGDSYEHEADRAADAAVRASSSRAARPISLDVTPLVQRAPAEPKKDDDKAVQKKADDSSTLVQRKHSAPHPKDSDDDDEKVAQKKTADPATEMSLETLGVPERVEAQIGALSSGGEPLPRAERAFFEDRFGYNFRDVRVHAGAGAATAASALNARAFTVGQNIFFGSGEYQPGSHAGRHLVAHELTHTIQQSPPMARAARVAQRDLIDDARAWALGKVHDWAVEVPGYKLLTGLIGSDPITDAPVTMTQEELIHEGMVEFVPDGEAIFQKLQADKTITQFLDYFHQQFVVLNLSWETVKTIFRQVWDDLGVTDLRDPAGAWEKIKARFGPPLERLKTFIINVGGYIIAAVKKKVLEWLRDWGTKIPGYPLLTFILGKDPFTDEPVPRTPTTFVKAVLTLVPGGDKIFDNLQKSHTIERTVEWLNQEVIKLDLTWEKIKALFSKAWDVISTSDLLNPIGFVDKIREIFEAPAIRVVNFAIDVGKKVLEFIFEGVMMLAGPLGQRVVGIFQKASASFSKIVADPVAFLGHLVDAVVLGFKQFVGKIGEYLEAGVIAWLTASLQGAGLTLPKVWDLKGILSLVLQILGITYAKMRAKIVKVLDEKTVERLEKVWSFLSALATEGPAAAWQKISEALGSLWNLVIGGIKDWAIVKIIKTAVAQLVTLFNPVGAVIEAVIETYRTIEFFVKKINQIVDLVEAIVNSIANIAAGQIAAAANYVEKTLARTVPVIIGFLASLVGLDDVSDGIRDTIAALQQKVDEAIDAAIAWIVAQVKALFGKTEEDEEEHDPKWDAAVAGVTSAYEALKASPEGLTPDTLSTAVVSWKSEFGFDSLEIESEGDAMEIVGSMSPKRNVLRVPVSINEEDIKVPSWVQVPLKGTWYWGRLLSKGQKTVNGVNFKGVDIEAAFPVQPPVTITTTLEAHGVSWTTKTTGGAPPVNPDLWADIRDKNEWDDYAFARPVLNYRASDGESYNNPPGNMQWHHIHEQNAVPPGPNTVENIALTTNVNNQAFSTWFGAPKSNVFTNGKSGDPLPDTSPKSVREWLKGRDNSEHDVWGRACIAWYELNVTKKSNTKGAWQELE